MEKRLTKTQNFGIIAFAAYMTVIAGLTVMQALPEPLPSWANTAATRLNDIQIYIFVWGIALACLVGIPFGMIAFLINLNRRG